jgi:hypothetical protein
MLRRRRPDSQCWSRCLPTRCQVSCHGRHRRRSIPPHARRILRAYGQEPRQRRWCLCRGASFDASTRPRLRRAPWCSNSPARSIALGRDTSLFHTTEERDGMMKSGMETGMNQSYAALDKVLASP